MGLKRKSKVNAQFNMSSLTDIIFLLLIFFMLTSSIVAPNALNLLLPGNSKSTTQTESFDDVRVRSNGTYEWNRSKMSRPQLESQIRKLARKEKSKRSFTITTDKKAPIENVVYVMDAALRMKVNAVLLPEK